MQALLNYTGEHLDTTGQPPFELTDTDREVLALSDKEFHAQTWTELKEIIRQLHNRSCDPLTKLLYYRRQQLISSETKTLGP